MQAPSSQSHLPCLEHLDPSNWSDLDDIEEPLIANSGHSQTHGLGKVKGTEMTEAFGLFDAYYVLGSLEGRWGDNGWSELQS